MNKLNKLWIIIPHKGMIYDERLYICYGTLIKALSKCKFDYQIVISEEGYREVNRFGLDTSKCMHYPAEDRFDLAQNIMKMLYPTDLIVFIDSDDCVTEDYFDFEPNYEQLLRIYYSKAVRHIPAYPRNGARAAIVEVNQRRDISDYNDLKKAIDDGTFGSQVWGIFYPTPIFGTVLSKFMVETKSNPELRRSPWEDIVWWACFFKMIKYVDIQKVEGTYVWNRYRVLYDNYRGEVYDFENNISLCAYENMVYDSKFLENLILARKICGMRFQENTKQACILFWSNFLDENWGATGIVGYDNKSVSKFLKDYLPLLNEYRISINDIKGMDFEYGRCEIPTFKELEKVSLEFEPIVKGNILKIDERNKYYWFNSYRNACKKAYELRYEMDPFKG